MYFSDLLFYACILFAHFIIESPTAIHIDSNDDVFDYSVGRRSSEVAAAFMLQDEDLYNLEDREAIPESSNAPSALKYHTQESE